MRQVKTPTPRKQRVAFNNLETLISARKQNDTQGCRRAEQALIVECLPIATAVARRYRRNGIDAQDTEQIAREGLVKAIRRWQPDKGPLLGYLLPTIHGEVKRYFRDNGSTVKIPRSLYEARPRVAEVERDLSQELGRKPAPSEVAAAADLDTQQVQQVKATGSAVQSLTTADGDSWLMDMMCQSNDHRLPMVDWRTILRPALEELSPRERDIVALRFVWGQNQQQIAAAVGVSQMHVSRLLRGILQQLRDRLETVGVSEA